MKRVLVIIVTYNGMRWLDRCLSSVFTAGKTAQNPSVAAETVITAGQTAQNPSVDVFVVDNDSTDGSADWIEGHFPGVKLVRSAENLGFTKANNLGFEWAVSHDYDYVYLLNQDAWLAPGALEMLVASAEEHPEYAVLSPLQMTEGYQAFDAQFAKLYPGSVEGVDPQTHGHPRPCKREGPTAASSDALRNGRGRSEAEADWGSTPSTGPVVVKRMMAAHWLVPVGALRKIGPFSELFPYYGQDDDWCHRARYHGFKLGVVPQARAVHDRALRQEPLERIIDRNYRVGSLVRLCDINRPLWERFLFVCLFTLVKAVKYRSFLPFKHFRSLCAQLPAIRAHRASCQNGR